MLDIARDPRWGRIVEGPGEDPYLASAIAAAHVRGFQGSRIGSADHIIAGPKHYAGYGASLGGRDYDEVNVSDSEFWNVYVQPFAAAVKAGAGNVMAAYMPLNGVPAAGNRWLLTDVLRGALKFKGFVVSDANGVVSLETQHFAKDKADAAVRALDAGVDMEMNLGGAAYQTLPDALAHGKVSAAAVDGAVRRVLEAKIRMGLFEHPYVDEARAATVLDDPAHREAARITAERSAVLLRNEGGVLPARDARPVELQLHARRDGDDPRRHPREGLVGQCAIRARHHAAESQVPVAVRDVPGQHARAPGELRREGRVRQGRGAGQRL
jgi:beta-glucosidase